MRTIGSAYLAALSERRLVLRDFLDITARERDTGNPVRVGFWSDLANVTALVVDPDTGAPSLREWYGAGGLISISDIPAVSHVTVENITIVMSQLDEQVEEAVRLYDVKQARAQIFRGLLDPFSGQLVAPAEPRFVGFVDKVEITTPAEGDDGGVRLTVASHAQELLRSNPSLRGDRDQRRARDGDAFFRDAAVVGDWGPVQWGPKEVAPQPERRRGLLGLGGFLGFL